MQRKIYESTHKYQLGTINHILLGAILMSKIGYIFLKRGKMLL